MPYTLIPTPSPCSPINIRGLLPPMDTLPLRGHPPSLGWAHPSLPAGASDATGIYLDTSRVTTLSWTGPAMDKQGDAYYIHFG